MLKKINIFLSFILALNLSSYTTYANDDYLEVELIKQEDEHLLGLVSESTKQISKQEIKQRKAVVPSIIENYNHPIYPTQKERQQQRQEEKDWFKPLSSLQKEIAKPVDPRFAELKKQINSCYDDHAQNLNLEKSFLRSGNIYTNTSFISQTFETINSCYEDTGLDIIANFYNNDTTLLQTYSKKVKTFYITGVDANFSGKHCGDKCSLEALIDEQISKFGEFKAYLLDLLSTKERQ